MSYIGSYPIIIFLTVKLLVGVFILLINVKMPTVVGILTFMCRMNSVLSCVEHQKSFITLGTGHPSLINSSSVCIYVGR